MKDHWKSSAFAIWDSSQKVSTQLSLERSKAYILVARAASSNTDDAYAAFVVFISTGNSSALQSVNASEIIWIKNQGTMQTITFSIENGVLMGTGLYGSFAMLLIG